MIKFGSFDPLYPNGIMSIANDINIFGVRITTFNRTTGELIQGYRQYYADLQR